MMLANKDIGLDYFGRQWLEHFSPGLRDDGVYHAWIYLTDKGLFGEAEIAAALIEVEEALDEHTAFRRSKVLGSELVDEKDLSVAVEYIDEIELYGVDIRVVSKWLNAISVEASPNELAMISGLPFVDHIDPVYAGVRKEPVVASNDMNQNLEVSSSLSSRDLDYGFSYLQMEQINAIAAHNAGYNGEGVTILMLDTGYYTDHAALQNLQIIDEWDFINGDNETQNQASDVSDQHDHGTATVSAVGGFMAGELIGPAYAANFLLAKTEDLTQEQPIEEDWYVAALEWGETLGADVASSSLGYIDWYDFEDLDGLTAVTTLGVNMAMANGMVVVTAAGNEGEEGIIAPADAFEVISVGAVDSGGQIAYFSSRGPTADGRIKPEVSAMGYQTYAAVADMSNSSYASMYGTSLSTPLVAGAVAMVLQAHPDWTPIQVREALMMTADNAANPNNTYGWGIIDVMAAINYIFTDPCIIIESSQVMADELMVEMSNTGFVEGDHYHAHINDQSEHMYYSDNFSVDIDCNGEDHELTVVTADDDHNEYNAMCATASVDFTALSTDCAGECGGSAMLADVNGDTNIDVLDIVMLVNIILNGTESNSCANVNGDESINVQDIILIVNMILGDDVDGVDF